MSADFMGTQADHGLFILGTSRRREEPDLGCGRLGRALARAAAGLLQV